MTRTTIDGVNDISGKINFKDGSRYGFMCQGQRRRAGDERHRGAEEVGQGLHV
jgi:hypothetical protein